MSAALVLLLFSQGCRGCREKEEEQEITITLQTEKPTDTTLRTSPAIGSSSLPVEEKGRERASIKPSPRPAVARAPAAPPPPQPPVPQQPAVQQPQNDDESLIRQVIDRQKKAFEAKDVSLYLSDLAASTDKMAGDVKKFFDRYNAIHVNFSVESVSVQGDKGEVTMIQETKLKPKDSGEPQETRVRVLWGFVRKGTVWKIAETKKLEDIR